MRIGLRTGVAVAGLWLALAPAWAQQNPAMENPSVVQPKDDTPPLPGANSYSESQARKLIESQGYSDVSALMNDREGIWRGTAKQGAAQVHVTVDYKGHVTANKE